MQTTMTKVTTTASATQVLIKPTKATFANVKKLEKYLQTKR